MWKLAFLFVLALITTILLSFSWSAPIKPVENAKFCQFTAPLAEYNFQAPFYGFSGLEDDSTFNLVHPKTNKTITFIYNPRLLDYHLDDKNVEDTIDIHDVSCDCMKKVVNETANPGDFMRYSTELQCLQEKCLKDATYEEKNELQKLYMRNPEKVCDKESIQEFCDCYVGEYLSLEDKYFGNDYGNKEETK